MVVLNPDWNSNKRHSHYQCLVFKGSNKLHDYRIARDLKCPYFECQILTVHIFQFAGTPRRRWTRWMSCHTASWPSTARSRRANSREPSFPVPMRPEQELTEQKPKNPDQAILGLGPSAETRVPKRRFTIVIRLRFLFICKALRNFGTLILVNFPLCTFDKI